MFPKINVIHNTSTILQRKTSLALRIWLILLVTCLIVFLIIAFKFNYCKYDTYLGTVKKSEDTYNVLIYVKNIMDLKGNLLIDKQKYDYQIKSISSDYYLVDNSNYYQVELSLSLKNEWLIENNILEIVFEKPATTLFKQMKEGLKLWKN